MKTNVHDKQGKKDTAPAPELFCSWT